VSTWQEVSSEPHVGWQVPPLQAKPSQQLAEVTQVALVTPQKPRGAQNPLLHVPSQQGFAAVQAEPLAAQANDGGGPPSKQTPGTHWFACWQSSPVQARPAWQSIALAQGPPAACKGAQPLLLPPLELPLTLELATPLELPPTLELAATLELPPLLVPPRLLLAAEELALLEVVPTLVPPVDAPEVAVVVLPPEDELDEPAPVREPPPPLLPFLQPLQGGLTSLPWPGPTETESWQAAIPKKSAPANTPRATLIATVWRRLERASTKRAEPLTRSSGHWQ
jgi:hypothetical protein